LKKCRGAAAAEPIVACPLLWDRGASPGLSSRLSIVCCHL
jgi:hypothetical protein